MKFTTVSTTLAAVLALTLTSATASSSADGSAKQHRGLARRLRAGEDAETGAHYVNLQKRYSGRASFYNNEVSEGACGGYSSSGDNIVALNVGQYGNPNAVSSWCGKKIQISYGGVTQTATVVDCCPSCPYGGLDMSKGLFSAFASFDKGLFQMSWTAAGDAPAQPKKVEKPKTTHTTSHRTTSTHSSTSTTPTTTSSSSSSSSSSSTSSSSTETSSSSTSTDANAQATPAPANNLDAMRMAMQGMLNIAGNAAGQ